MEVVRFTNTMHTLISSSSPRWNVLALRWYLSSIRHGFVVHTLLSAVVLWLLICGPSEFGRLIRRFSRTRRGLCPKCAYPMGESAVCTECGKTLPGPARVAT